MSEEQQVNPCVHCNEYNEQMLMVSCMHDPCINCAAIHYVQNAPKNSLFYPCAKCNQETQLDSSSVVELQRVYRSIKPPPNEEPKKYDYNRNISKRAKEPSASGKNSRTKYQDPVDDFEPYDYKKIQNPVSDKYQSNYKGNKTAVGSYTPPPQNYPQTSYVSSHSVKKLVHPQTTLMCTEHPEDQLTYFCFSCSKPICPQCAIHGAHKQHDVQTTRRAIKQIKARLGEANQKLSTEIGHLVNKKEQGRRQLKQLADNNKKDHEQLKRYFGKLRTLLVEKEKQFLHTVNSNYQRSCEEIKHHGSAMDKFVEGYNAVRRNIDITLKRDDLTVLQEFSKREDESADVLDRNSALTQESGISGSKKIDYPLLEDELEQLSGIVQGMRLTFASNKNQY